MKKYNGFNAENLNLQEAWITKINININIVIKIAENWVLT